jgi:hypothetical protein
MDKYYGVLQVGFRVASVAVLLLVRADCAGGAIWATAQFYRKDIPCVIIGWKVYVLYTGTTQPLS